MNNNKNDLVEKIDITPSTNIYRIFQKLTYKHSSAISEFVDNSTQSYKDNKNTEKNIIPQIYVLYYEEKGNEKIQILDNCYGIKNSNLERVLKLNVPPTFSSRSRNEFGMGLKTASFWFGSELIVLSKFISESKTVKIRMSLENLDKKDIIPDYKEESFFEQKTGFKFGTLLQIQNLSKKLTDKRLNDIKDALASKYREDINVDKLQIRIIKICIQNKNGNFARKLYDVSRISEDQDKGFYEINSYKEAIPIEFKEPKITEDENGNEIKVLIDDYLLFEDVKYHISGWVGILETGSRQNAGLILFKDGRSITGDDERGGYRPKKIVGDTGSFPYQRIYGKIYLDDFPIVQAKNDFDWHNGLEDEFIDFMYKKLTDENLNLIKIANKIRKNKTTLEKKEIISVQTAKDVEEEIKQDNSFKDFSFTLNNEGIFEGIIVEENGKTFEFNLFVLKGSESEGKDWLEIIPDKYNKNKFNLYLNLDLSFFNPFNEDINNVKYQMIRFCIYFSYAEIKHRSVCSDSSDIRSTLNKCITNILKTEVKKGE